MIGHRHTVSSVILWHKAEQAGRNDLTVVSESRMMTKLFGYRVRHLPRLSQHSGQGAVLRATGGTFSQQLLCDEERISVWAWRHSCSSYSYTARATLHPLVTSHVL